MEPMRQLLLLEGTTRIITPNKEEQVGISEEGTISPNIHNLPPELLHMICAYLEPMDVAGIRLLDRSIAAVGLEHLVSQIHLIAKPDSFDRLLAVAEHPSARRYVTSLFYEANMLRPHRVPQVDRERWEETIVMSDDAGSLEELQDPSFVSACDHLPKKYIRRPLPAASNRRLRYTKRELQQGYKTYRSYRTEQCRMNESVAYEEALVGAMKQLPNLKSIIVSCRRGLTTKFRAAFRAGLSEDVSPDPANVVAVGSRQLSFILSAADKAGLQIKKLVCGSLDHFFLYQSFGRRDAVERSIHGLQSLHLFLSQPDEFNPNARPNPNDSGSTGIMSMNFASLAPNLEILSIHYNEDRPSDPPDLEHLVRNFHWSFLASASFAKMNTGRETLIDFCDRHAGTLKDFTLVDIRLLSGGWPSTICAMRQKLELKNMTFAGIVQSFQGDHWDFEAEKADQPAKEMVERYILHDDPLRRDLPYDMYVIQYML